MKNPILFLLLSATATLTSMAQPAAWQLVKTSNTIPSRNECGLAALGSTIYLIGGDGPAMDVQTFEPMLNAWKTKATAPISMHHFQAVGLNNKIYVLDAFYQGQYPNQIPAPNAYCYDIQKNVWVKLAGLPANRQRGGAGAAAYNGKLYLVNGITHGHTSGTNAMFDCYDPKTDTWVTLPDAPHIRDHSQAVVVGDKLYALGGRNTSLHDANNFMSFYDKVVLDVDVYDFKTGKWSTTPFKLPTGTGGGTAVAVNGKIFFIGGERATKTKPNGPQKDVFFLDTKSPMGWTKSTDLNIARNGVGGAVIGNTIYIAGGAARLAGLNPIAGPNGPKMAGNTPLPTSNPAMPKPPANGMQPPMQPGMQKGMQPPMQAGNDMGIALEKLEVRY